MPWNNRKKFAKITKKNFLEQPILREIQMVNHPRDFLVGGLEHVLFSISYMG
jgi:hypothetical protein